MIHRIWLGLLTVGILFSFVNGTTADVNQAILAGAKEAIDLIIYLAGVLVFWTGILQVALKANMLDVLSKMLTPLTRFLYPKLSSEHPAIKYLTTNMVANLLGLGSAATPTGLKAMEELQKSNPRKESPTYEMCTLLVLNTAGFTLIPTTIIGIRHLHGSSEPTAVFLPILFASGLASLGGLCVHMIYSRLKGIHHCEMRQGRD